MYVHIKVYKGKRVFAEVISHTGDLQLRCRECLRWHTLVFNYSNSSAGLVAPDKDAVPEDEPATHV